MHTKAPLKTVKKQPKHRLHSSCVLIMPFMFLSNSFSDLFMKLNILTALIIGKINHECIFFRINVLYVTFYHLNHGTKILLRLISLAWNLVFWGPILVFYELFCIISMYFVNDQTWFFICRCREILSYSFSNRVFSRLPSLARHPRKNTFHVVVPPFLYRVQ